MLKRYFPIRLVKWFLVWSTTLLSFSLAAVLIIFSLFFDKTSFPFIWGFGLGFLLSTFLLGILYFRILGLIGRVVEKVRSISQGGDRQDYKDSFTKELGEIYELHKNLNKINDKLRWQKKIIGQESSELEAVISAVRGAILAINENQKVLFFNRQATLLFGHNKKPKKHELFLSELVRSPDILDCYRECLESGEIVTKKIESDLFGGDEDRSYEVSVAPLREPNRRIQGAVGLFYDITDIEKTEKRQVDFISNVSHELRTPLTAIQGYVQTLLIELKDNRTDKMQKFLEIINRNVKRLVSLLNHFLELSRWEATMDMKKETLSTQEITESIVKDLHIKNHDLKFDFSAKTVVADRHFLKQVLYNLLDNAVRYVPKGRLIEVIWTKKPQWVELIVKDQGEGIQREHKDRVFEKFYRVDSARTKSSGNVSGIGLYIVKEIIEKHGGTITLVSRENEGSRFICTFPEPEVEAV
ncbi:MAG: ATP-binding protein [Bdellovibrionales bacterium]|nr:ATP-binding protein [Bdellovibrionales bacterium]